MCVCVFTGNPLQPELLSMANDMNGTSKLLMYLLDNLSGMYQSLSWYNTLCMYVCNDSYVQYYIYVYVLYVCI